VTATAVPIDQLKSKDGRAQSVKSPIPIDEGLRVELDRCGFLLDEYKRHKPWLDELEKLKKDIRAKCKDLAADAPLRLDGAAYYIDLGMKENEKRLTDKGKAFAALRKAMGLEKLIDALTITFKLLDQWVPEPLQKKFMAEERTGSRAISAVAKESPEAA
jgi:hypothetical protein